MMTDARGASNAKAERKLPEPIVTNGHDDPARHAETADSLSLTMLESLWPDQRAVLLLHDELAWRFFAAAEQGDLAGLEALLAHGVELTGDGGGKVPTLARAQPRRAHADQRDFVCWPGFRACPCVPSRSTAARERSFATDRSG